MRISRFTSQVQKLDTVDSRTRIVLSARFAPAIASIQAWSVAGHEIIHASHPPVILTDEHQQLLEIPSIRSYPSFRFAPLLALKVAELLDQVGEVLGHG